MRHNLVRHHRHESGQTLKPSRCILRRVVPPTLLVLTLCTVPWPFHTEALAAWQDQTSPAQQSRIQAGKALFSATCANGYCHQGDGGGVGPTNLQHRRFTLDEAKQIISSGIPGTSMPSWKSRYTADQIAQLAAFVLSLSREDENENGPIPPGGMTVLLGSLPAGGKSFAIVQPLSDDLRPEERAAHAAAEAKIGGSAAAGRELFYDDAEPEECAICHTYRGRGGTIGPDLTGMSDRSPDEILERITKPRSAGEGRYVTVVLTTRDGQRYVGIKRDENKERIRVYDASSMPPVSRAFQKSDIVEVNVLDRSVMPADYASRYSQKQLLDLVAFLKLGAPIPKINNDPN